MTDSSHKIYTRFGDRGQTRLLSGERVGKDDLRVNTYGALDELQSHLGMARSLIKDGFTRTVLHAVQKDLFVAGAELASTPEQMSQLGNRIGPGDVARLERWIDQTTERYGLPGGFVVPGSSPESSALHVARSVARRVERLTVSLNRVSWGYDQTIVYFNRLSDLLFVLAWATAVTAAVEQVVDDMHSGRK